MVERRGQNASALCPEDDRWMDGLSAVDVIRPCCIDPSVIITPEGKLVTPEGEDYEAILFDDSGTSFRRERLGGSQE